MNTTRTSQPRAELCRIRTRDGRRYWIRAASLPDHGRYPLLLPVCDRRGADTGLFVPRALVDAIQ